VRPLLVTGCLLLHLLAGTAAACTIISGRAPDGDVWTGNNEDFGFDFDTYLNVLPSEKGRLGAIAFTYNFAYDRPEAFVQGGLNEQGLFFDFNALPGVPVTSYRGWETKRDFPGGDVAFIKHVLRTCATVPEVIALFATYRLPSLLEGQMHVADRLGNLALVNADSILVTTGPHLVSTNFNACTGRSSAEAASCRRYPVAERMLATRGVSFESFRAVMDSTQPRRGVSTVFTNIADLTTGDIHFYYAGDFRKSWHFRIQDLVARGKRSYLMRELFRDAPIVEIWERYQSEGAVAAVRHSRSMQDTLPESVRADALRHLACGALFVTNRYADARVFMNEWLEAQGRRDPASDFHEGLARLATGDYDGARVCLARQAEADSADPVARRASLPGVRALLARLEGRPVPGANARFELKAHQDARFVCVGGISRWPVTTFLTRTADGWAGEFVLPPGKTHYAFLVDGRVMRDPANRRHEVVLTEDGRLDLSVRTID
jgi:hypothetical protein